MASALIVFFKKGSPVSAALFAVSAAMTVCGIYTLLCYYPAINLDKEEKKISGVVVDIRRYSGDLTSYTVETNLDGTGVELNFLSNDKNCNIGDKVSFTAKLSVLKDNSNFAEEGYYKSKGIFLKAQSVKNFEITEKQRFNIKAVLYEFGDYIADRITLFLPNQEGGLIKAMLLGNKTGLSDSLSVNIRRCGISHFTAVSGLHLTVISYILMLIISFTPISKNRNVRFGFLVVFILLFVVFFKMSMSVIRAGIMLILFYGSELFGRKADPLSSMGIAILLVTLFQPYACIDIGFLMSLAGTFGAAVVSPYFCKYIKHTKTYALKSAFLTTFCITITTFPFCCLFFGGFSVLGIFVNLIIYPLFIVAFVFAAVFALTLGNAPIALIPGGLSAKAMVYIINYIGGLKYSYITIKNNTFYAVLIIFTALCAIVYFVFKSKRITITAIIGSCILIVSSAVIFKINDYNKTKLVLYSDGNDACAIIQQYDTAAVFISSDSYRITEYVKSYMRDCFLDKVSVIALLNEKKNNLKEINNISCDKTILSDEYITFSNSNNKLTFEKSEGAVVVNVKGISISMSPAKAPLDTNINIIYGYKKVFPKLTGMVLFADNKMNAENSINLYYQPTEFYITDDGILERSD